jgi:hypothetical protein
MLRLPRELNNVVLGMGRKTAAGLVCLATLSLGAPAQAAHKCAKAEEVTAIQAAAIQQELMVAALTCDQVTNFNAFQTSFGPELRAYDSKLERMFRRLYGGKGEGEYHAFKTRLANHSSMRSITDNPSYCHEARDAFGTALAPDKPTLAGFASTVPVYEQSPVVSCAGGLTVGVAAATAVPNVMPQPNPQRLAIVSEPAASGPPGAVVPPAETPAQPPPSN